MKYILLLAHAFMSISYAQQFNTTLTQSSIQTGATQSQFVVPFVHDETNEALYYMYQSTYTSGGTTLYSWTICRLQDDLQTEVWYRTITSSSSKKKYHALCLDNAAQYVYAVGTDFSSSQDNGNIIVYKFSTNQGSSSWSTIISSTGNFEDDGMFCSVDSSDEKLYVGSNTGGPLAGFNSTNGVDIALSVHNTTNGNLIQATQFGSSVDDSITGLKVFETMVYVAYSNVNTTYVESVDLYSGAVNTISTFPTSCLSSSFGEDFVSHFCITSDSTNSGKFNKTLYTKQIWQLDLENPQFPAILLNETTDTTDNGALSVNTDTGNLFAAFTSSSPSSALEIVAYTNSSQSYLSSFSMNYYSTFSEISLQVDANYLFMAGYATNLFGVTGHGITELVILKIPIIYDDLSFPSSTATGISSTTTFAQLTVSPVIPTNTYNATYPGNTSNTYDYTYDTQTTNYQSLSLVSPTVSSSTGVSPGSGTLNLIGGIITLSNLIKIVIVAGACFVVGILLTGFIIYVRK